MSQVYELDKLTAENVALIAKMEQHAHQSRTLGERVADRVALGVGSWSFLIVQSVLLVFWMGINVTALWIAWDPFPFVLLNLVLSFQAAFSTPVILMSQNRQALLSERRNHLDLQVNLLAEQENTEQVRLLRLLCEKAGVPSEQIHSEPFEQTMEPEKIVNQIKDQVERGLNSSKKK